MTTTKTKRSLAEGFEALVTEDPAPVWDAVLLGTLARYGAPAEDAYRVVSERPVPAPLLTVTNVGALAAELDKLTLTGPDVDRRAYVWEHLMPALVPDRLEGVPDDLYELILTATPEVIGSIQRSLYQFALQHTEAVPAKTAAVYAGFMHIFVKVLTGTVRDRHGNPVPTPPPPAPEPAPEPAPPTDPDLAAGG